MEHILESLNPDERKIIPYLKEHDIKKIIEKTGFDETRALRALQFLSNKNILKLKISEKKIINLGDNGIIYKKGLPERKLLNLLHGKNLPLQEALKLSGLDDNEFKAAIGVLKKKALIDLKDGRIFSNATKEEVSKKSLEEQLIEKLPLPLESLQPEQKFALEALKSRKDIIIIQDSRNIQIELTELGKKISSQSLDKYEDMIEQVTSEIIKSESWKGKKFRRYDITSKVPDISGGKRHFVSQATDYAREIWTDLGFKEMTSTLVQTGFWNFDVLFTAQDHPVREMQDTFYIKDVKGKLPDKKIIEEIKKAHEGKIKGSKGWGYTWNEEYAKKVLLRTHTTAISSHILSKLKLNDLPQKFFAVGKCFRNETLDWSHGFEFNQTEGIVVDKNANFRHLLGYLKEFYKKMGFDEIKFVPSYFPYTEPSIEIYAFNKQKQVWMEVGGAGIFRPEVVIPIFGEYVPVLAWGPGFDRTLMSYYEIKDLREMYRNDLSQIRKMRFWIK